MNRLRIFCGGKFIAFTLSAMLFTTRVLATSNDPAVPEAMPVSSECILFAAGNPQPWAIKTIAISGGTAKLTPDGAVLDATFEQPNDGCGVIPRPYPQAQDWVNDTYVEIAFDGNAPKLPEHMQIKLRVQASPSSKDKRLISSDWVSVSKATPEENGIRRLRIKLTSAETFAREEVVTGAFVVSREPGNMTIRHMSLQKLRNVSVQATNNYRTNLNKLELEGSTLEPAAFVTIEITDAAGKAHGKNVVSKGGKFSLTWEAPPLSAGKESLLSARIGDPADPMNKAVPVRLFGYDTNTDNVWLSVKGKEIVTTASRGAVRKAFIACGVGYAKDVIIPAQDEAVAKFCEEHGLNTIRLPIYTRFFNSDANKPIDLDYHIKTFIDPVIQAAKRHRLYVILDDHCYFSEKVNEATARSSQTTNRWDEKGVEAWVAGWAKLSSYYKDEPYVLGYELANEPHDIDPKTVREWYGRAVREIRKVDTRHILFVGNSNWSHSRSLESTWGTVASTFDAPYNNIVYAFHDYPEDDDPLKVQKSITSFRDEHGVPVLCTEFGATWWNKDETVCRKFQAGMLSLFAKEHVGWMVWALGSLNDNPRNATPPMDKIRKEQNIPRLPKSEYDSCAYSDIWAPMAQIMASNFPEPRN